MTYDDMNIALYRGNIVFWAGLVDEIEDQLWNVKFLFGIVVKYFTCVL